MFTHQPPKISLGKPKHQPTKHEIRTHKKRRKTLRNCLRPPLAEKCVGRQKLRKNCDFKLSIATLFARNGRWTSKTEEKWRFYLVNRNPFARNGRWTPKTEEKLRWTLSFLYKCLCVKRLCVKAFVFQSVCVCKSVCV